MVLAAEPTIAARGMQILKGADTATVARDRIVVSYLGGPEEPLGSGNRLSRVSVSVVSGADPDDDDEVEDALARHTLNCEAVFHFLENHAGLAAALSAAVAHFHVFDPVSDEGENPDVEGRGWIESRIYSQYCCGVAIA